MISYVPKRKKTKSGFDNIMPLGFIEANCFLFYQFELSIENPCLRFS